MGIQELINFKRQELAELERQQVKEAVESLPQGVRESLRVCTYALTVEDKDSGLIDALRQIMKSLSPELFNLFENDERAAYRLAFDMVNGYGAYVKEFGS